MNIEPRTLEDFLERLRNIKGENWYIAPGGSIRCGRNVCPLAAIFHLPTSKLSLVLPAANDFGLSDKLTWEIIFAADNSPAVTEATRNTKHMIRRAILETLELSDGGEAK